MSLFSATIAVSLVVATGGVIDYAQWSGLKADLQSAADTAALSSAKEMAITNSNVSQVRDVATNYAKVNFENSNPDLGGDAGSLAVSVAVKPEEGSVKVDLTYVWDPFFLHYVTEDLSNITATATASLALADQQKICVVALDAETRTAIRLKGRSKITANGCAVYSNSDAKKAILPDRNASIKSASTYVVGGYGGSGRSYDPEPITSSPLIGDPLADRIPPTIGSCVDGNSKGTIIRDEDSVTLEPGTYCGGLEIRDEAKVKLSPGNYIMKDGPLLVKDDAELKGENAGFYFVGKTKGNTALAFGKDTTISLTAPEEGNLAGILFFQDRESRNGQKFQIKSQRAGKFEGTVYLPVGELYVSWEEEEPDSIDKSDPKDEEIPEDSYRNCWDWEIKYGCVDSTLTHAHGNDLEDHAKMHGWRLRYSSYYGREFYWFKTSRSWDYVPYRWYEHLLGVSHKGINDDRDHEHASLPPEEEKSEPVQKVGETSNWTAIVAQRIITSKGPDLVLNSDYEASDIPLPQGIRDLSGKAYLSQ